MKSIVTSEAVLPPDYWHLRIGETSVVWAYAPLDEVRVNVAATGYPMDRVRFVPGPVEATIPSHAPEAVAILRLDTDWYESTKHELEHLVDRVSPAEAPIIDDYGHWQGARRAVRHQFLATATPTGSTGTASTTRGGA